jgi:hypothetical protein
MLAWQSAAGRHRLRLGCGLAEGLEAFGGEVEAINRG